MPLSSMTSRRRFITGAASTLFAAPYITGALQDLTGNDKAGMWAIGLIMLLGAALVVWLGAAPTSDRDAGARPDPAVDVTRRRRPHH